MNYYSPERYIFDVAYYHMVHEWEVDRKVAWELAQYVPPLINYENLKHSDEKKKLITDVVDEEIKHGSW